MKKYARIFRYLKAYKSKIVLYFIFILLSVVFSIVSVGMLMPFLDLIFKGKSGTGQLVEASNNFLIQYIRDTLVEIIKSGGENGKVKALAIVCVVILLSILFKNLFLYLSYYVLNPVKNAIGNSLRIDIYDKILRLPFLFSVK